MKSIIETDSKSCYICGHNRGLEEHHIFFGTANRRMSEKYGLKVHLCMSCHKDNKRGVHGQNKPMDNYLKEKAQRAFEQNHTREEFISVFGKNYL